MGADAQTVVTQAQTQSMEQLIELLKKYVQEPLQCFIFLDMSFTNEFQGRKTYNHGLHTMHPQTQLSPYEECMRSISPIIDCFDADQVYPVYKFGQEKDVIRPLLYPENSCPDFKGFQAVIQAYRKTCKKAPPGGLKHFWAVVKEGIKISKEFQAKGEKQHIIVLILTDGQFTIDAKDYAAIDEASSHPISICLIGIGDDDCADLQHIDTMNTGRRFDNVHFTHYTKFMAQGLEKNFMVDVFSEVVQQHIMMKKLGIL